MSWVSRRSYRSCNKESNVLSITYPHRLPSDFFDESPFGKSLAYPNLKNDGAVSSNLKIDKFKELGFPAGALKTLERGLLLLLHKTPTKLYTKNHKFVSEAENNEFLREALGKWESAHIFKYVENKPDVLNQLKVVVKENRKKLVLDARTSGLNDSILAPKFALPNIESIVNMETNEAYMIKTDLVNGFLQLPVNKQEQRYLGFQHPINDRFAVLQRLSFGLASAPFLFQTFTQMLEAATYEIPQVKTRVYMDDWFLSDPDIGRLQTLFDSFCNLLECLGVKLQHSKTEGPTKRMVYLGIGIDTEELKLFFPEEKRLKYLRELSKLLTGKEVTMEQMAKMAGRLVHISAIHRAGMGHVQPLWEIIYRERKIYTRRQLTQEVLQVEENANECLD